MRAFRSVFAMGSGSAAPGRVTRHLKNSGRFVLFLDELGTGAGQSKTDNGAVKHLVPTFAQWVEDSRVFVASFL